MRKKDKPVKILEFDFEGYKKQAKFVKWHCEALKKAEAGDLKAWEQVGRNYLIGMGVERSTDKAYECFQKGEVSAEAWTDIGLYYQKGLNEPSCGQNLDRAIECYRKAADMGNEEAQTELDEIEKIKFQEDFPMNTMDFRKMTEQEAIQTVEQLTDQAELAHAVRELQHGDARKKAIEKLTDEKHLTEIANGDEADYLTTHTVTYETEEYDEMEITGKSGSYTAGGCYTKIEKYQEPIDLRQVAEQRLNELRA